MTVYIEIIRDEHDAATRQARHDWAEVTGEEQELKPAVLLDHRTGWRYGAIAGAIGYPAGPEPGCMLVVGIQSQPQPRLVVLDYQEHHSVYDLFSDVVVTRTRYRFGHHDAILPTWLGDPVRYQSISVAVSTALEKKHGAAYGLYLREPVDWNEPHAFPMYLFQLRAALADKTLYLGKHADLISRLQAVAPDAVDKGKVPDFPSVGILGALVHTLMIEKPWEQYINRGKPLILEC